VGRRRIGRRGSGRLLTLRYVATAAAVAVLACASVVTAEGSALAEDSVAEASDPVRVSLIGLAPVALDIDSSLSASGTVSNSGLISFNDVAVRLTISNLPLPDRRSMRAGEDIGDAVETTPLYDSTEQIARVLRPGAKRTYRLSAARGTIPLTLPGIYVVGVEVTGLGPAGSVILGSTYTLMPYVPDPVEPVNVAWLWPLASYPAQTAEGVQLTEVVSREVQSGGRLAELVRVGSTVANVSWVVDPQLLQMTKDMSNGYLVERAGEVRPGNAQQAAGQWFDAVRDILGPPVKGKQGDAPPPDLLSLPYADPDVDASLRAGLASDVVRSATTSAPMTEEYLNREPHQVSAWASGGSLTPAALDTLAASGVTSVVLRDNAMPTATPLSYTPSGYADIATDSGPIRALLLDSGLLRALTAPQGNLATVLQARQRFLSELAFVALEPSPRPRYLIAGAGSVRWDPNPRLLAGITSGLRSTPWTRLVPVSAVLDLPPNNITRLMADYDSKARARELNPDYLAGVVSAQSSLTALRSVLSNPLRMTSALMAALLRAQSAAWRTRERTGVELLASVQADIDAIESQIYVIPRDNVTFSGDRGSVPITVANDLDQAVTVGVTVTAEPASRLEATGLNDVLIEAGKRASLEVPVRIVGGGALSVSIQLTDGAGAAFGAPVPLELRTTAYSRAATWVAIAAAVVLILLVLFDIVRRARSRRSRTEAPA